MPWVRIAATAILVMMGIPIILMWLKFFREKEKK
jgi:hypothetical protein